MTQELTDGLDPHNIRPSQAHTQFPRSIAMGKSMIKNIRPSFSLLLAMAVPAHSPQVDRMWVDLLGIGIRAASPAIV